MSEVGFIGLGIMGQGMAENLAKAGRKLIVWNRDPSKAAALASAFPGAVNVKLTAAEVVRAATCTYCMLSTLEASKAVFEGEHGVLAGVSPGKSIIDCATLTPERMEEMAAAVSSAGGKFLEAPVSGSKKPAADGQLIFLAAGDATVLDTCKPDLDVMGKATHYYGAFVGAGTKMKLAVNMTMGIQLAGLAEGVALCEAAGLSSESFIEVLKQGAMSSPLVAVKGAAMVARQYAPQFPLEHCQKDMRFAINAGDALGLGLPVAAASNELFKRARAAGKGSDDFSAVAEVARK
jgi:3-hydroxyisobutyrate dehydrogenase-like beta-hydroxyacid dehydrogenase